MTKNFMALCLLLLASPAWAQNPPAATSGFVPSLPIEVAMLYYNTIKTPPKFADWAVQSPTVKKIGSGFGQEAVIEQERQRLSQLYKKIGGQKTMFYSTTLSIDPEQSGPEQITFKGLDPDAPMVFDNFDQSYAVFVRNFAAYQTLQAPFEFLNATSMANLLGQNQPVRAEIVLKAVAADKMPLKIDPNKPPSLMMLADVVELSLLDGQGNVVAQKRYAGWQKASDLKNLFGGSAPLGGTLSNDNEDKQAVIPQSPAKD